MDYYLLADMTVQIGYELAVAGAETYRVEETMRRVIEAYGTEGQAFAIPNCVAVSFVTPNTKPLTIMKRVGYHGNDLERIEKLNALSRRICAEVPEPQEAQRWLKETTAAVRSYAVWIYYLGNFMAAAGFCCVFGGTVRVLTLVSLFSSRIIRSDSSHPSASQIRSRCSRFTLSAISWYRSLIVEGRMPVALARSACDHLRSPSRVDSKILIIAMLLYGRF